MQLKKCSFAVTALITCALAAHATDWSLPVMPGGGKAGASFENETYGGGTVAYVSKLGNHIAPFDTWEKAATNVQDAVASDTAMVIVSNGTYRVPTPDITLDKPIVLKSFSGPAETILDCTPNSGDTRHFTITHPDAIVSGFTLKGGNTGAYGFTASLSMSAGTVTNCTISGVRSVRRSSVCHLAGTAQILDCALDMTGCVNYNTAADMAALRLADNAVADRCHIHNATFMDHNSHAAVIVSGAAILRNSLVDNNKNGTTPNAASGAGGVRLIGGTVENCTISDNMSGHYGGGLWLEGTGLMTVRNTIIFDNTSKADERNNIHFTSTSCAARIINSCSPDIALLPETCTVTGSTTYDPYFDAENPYHLSLYSAVCIDKGASDGEPGTADLDGNSRIVNGVIDMGCFEHPGASGPIGLNAKIETSTTSGRAPLSVTFTPTIIGDDLAGLAATWNFGDGSASVINDGGAGSATDPNAEVSHIFTTPGAFTPSLTLNNTAGAEITVSSATLYVVPETICVSTNGSNTFPYDNWSNAATDLAAAIAYAPARVVVSNGTYRVPTPYIALLKPIVIESVGGPSNTILDCTPNGNVDTRHFFIRNDNVLVSGFTLQGGRTQNHDFCAVLEMSGGTVSNCHIRNVRRLSRSSAMRLDGTSKLVDCDIDLAGFSNGNSDGHISAVYLNGSSMADRCRIYGATAFGSRTYHAAVTLNSANATLRNSLVYNNVNGSGLNASAGAGGVRLVAGTIESCTISDNMCGNKGAGIYLEGTGSMYITNTIIFGNTARAGVNHDMFATSASCQAKIGYTCSPDLATLPATCTVGAECSTANPNFDTENPYHLTLYSAACRDKGTNTAWAVADGAIDLDGNPRIESQDGIIDMGCFEMEKSTAAIPLGVTVETTRNFGRAPHPVDFTPTVVGDNLDGLRLYWDFDDGETTSASGTTTVSHTFTAPGRYEVVLMASNSVDETAFTTNVILSVAEVCHVATNGTSVVPYLTAETAATNIQDAVALEPRYIDVHEGVYKSSGDGIILATNTEIRSLSGRDKTVIKGHGDRIALIKHSGAAIRGFTIRDGSSQDWGDTMFVRLDAGLLADCAIINGLDSYRAQGVTISGASRVEECYFNIGTRSGNAGSEHLTSIVLYDTAVMDRCVITNLNITSAGGSNLATAHEGAVVLYDSAKLRSTLVVGSMATASGTAQRGAVLVAGGSPVIENCTIIGNKSSNKGGGICVVSGATPIIHNNIVTGNSAAGGYNDIYDASSATAPRVSNTCASDVTDGVDGNINDPSEPKFRTSGPAYTPDYGSRLLNSGSLQPWMSDAFDIYGNPRVRNSYPDIGAVEGLLPPGTMIIVR